MRVLRYSWQYFWGSLLAGYNDIAYRTSSIANVLENVTGRHTDNI